MTDADKKYIALCDEVNRRALQITGAGNNGRADRAADLALALCDYVCTEKHQLLMQRERVNAGAYDLTALHVDASVPSSSETGFEDCG